MFEVGEPSRRVPPPLPCGGGGGSARRTRKPLSDCTNTARNSSQSSSSSSASVLKPRVEANFSIPQSRSHFITKISTIAARNPSSGPVAPGSGDPSLALPKSSSASGQDLRVTLDPCTVRTRGRDAQKTTTKSKALTMPVNSSPVRKNRVSGSKLDHVKEGSISKLSVMSKKRKQHPKREQDETKKALEDYIQQQRSYYAEIDAFELSEEEDLDLRRPGVWNQAEKHDFEVTTAEVLKKADFRNVRFLANLITEAGIIIKRSKTGISAKAQRKIAREIKTARAFGLMSFTTTGTKSFVYGKSMQNL